MSATDTVFAGSIPAIYDRYMVPLIFAPYAQLFPDGSDAFYERIPFRYHQREWIERDLRAAGFSEIEFEKVELHSRAASARDAAIGLTQGTPMRSEIEQRDPAILQRATDGA